jgi:membrane-anchored mycosin MYCP
VTARVWRVPAGALALALAGTLAAVAVPADPAAGAPNDNCAQQPQDQTTPWAQRMLGVDRAWVLSRGAGQKIALLDSGVDATQPQLAGHVDDGFDAITGTVGAGNTDCLGTGTEVAGVMVAQPSGSGGLAGVAPSARVLPVRVVAAQGSAPPTVDSGALAKGISWAVGQRVDVICVAVAVYTDDSRVAQAVREAQSVGIPVIAAVGDRGGANDSNPTPYPAGYAGVVGVGAVDAAGARWAASGHGRYVDVTAPGVNVLTTWRGRGVVPASGTGVAAGFVAATAALATARGNFTPAQLRAQLQATALPAAGGPGSTDFGAGVVNPYGAVSELISGASPAAPAEYEPRAQSQAERDRAAAWAASRDLAVLLAAVAVGLVLLVLLAALAIPRGRRRAWRPTLAARPVDRPEPEEPSPPALLFEE